MPKPKRRLAKKSVVLKPLSKRYTKKQTDANGNINAEWIPNNELLAIISDCTGIIRADVLDVLECYFILLREALLKGYVVNFPEIGYFTNEYVPERVAVMSVGMKCVYDGNTYEYTIKEHNRPVFKFFNSFKKEMRVLTEDDPYEFEPKRKESESEE